ncbi:unnamed protein product [Mytilus coruscus]|uniref:Uncharacterized protein n=1 Tax=Mytilus coruscus TaxID=42192 RepID=A0A6J8CRA1_MYTCO|nr:unnamed protein product [Mytilus coruscus]
MLRFIDTFFFSNIHEQRDRLNLPLKQPPLATFDDYAAHRVECFINKLQKAGILFKYVPGGCTGDRQLFDLSGNSQIKELCFIACSSRKKKDGSKIVFYAGAVGLLEMAFLIGMLVSGVKYKYCSRQRVSEEKNDERHYATEESLEKTDQNPGTVLFRLPVPRNFVKHQLNETSENDHKDTINSRYGNRIEDEGYLNSNQLIQAANIYKHDYMAINAETPTEKADDEYLHPYNSLLKHGMSEDHEYKYLRKKPQKSEFEFSERNKFQYFV